jgi:serine/threonine protein kinase
VNDETWYRVKEIFHEAMRRPAEARREFLDAACGDDRALRSEVEALLGAHEEIGEESLPSRPGAGDDTEVGVFNVEGPGTVIGRYKLLEQIGEGGMGVVYLAQQEEPIRRRVALKIIKLGMDTKEVVARFEAERQALAMMDHTHIAKVFDAGTTDQGRPYFVMEYVPGIPITDYCDQHRLSTKERLELYVPVCQAIHHAHQRAVIHRDVKPTNVLVMIQDGAPVPKVIDFGVAKAMNQRLTEKTLFTAHGVLIGTPVYMSPEQAEMTGLNVDTTSDVYSLGALLYELLSGAPPFDPRSLREAGFEAIHRMIREVEPPKPSTRFLSLGGEATTVAQRRRTEPAELERQIRGELDWITMRAMEKDRRRRYQSASEFAADIERYLRNEPVVASPPSVTYRMRKFVRRHKAGASVVAAGIVILLGFAAMMAVQADRVARERDRAQLEARRSRLEAEALQAILLEDKDLLADSSSVYVARRVREAWTLHRRSPAENAAGGALYAVNLLRLLDFTEDWGGGDKTAALALKAELEVEAFGLIHRAMAERDTSVLRSMDLMIARLEDKAGRDGESELVEQLYRDTLALLREVRPPDDPSLKRNLVEFAEYLETKGRRALIEGRPADAEPVLRELLQLRLEINPPESGWTHFPAIARGLLGECLTELNRYAEAEPLLLESLEVLDTRDARIRVIGLYESWGKPEGADRYRKNLWVESIREIGAIGTPEVRDMYHCASIPFAGRSVWVFGNSHASRGQWAWTNDRNASDGITLHEPGPLGQGPFLARTAEEKVLNESRLEPGEWALWPGPVITDRESGRALLVYSKARVRSERPHRQVVGRSLAVWAHPDSAIVRPVVRPEAEYPTMLFQGDEPELGAGAVVDDGFLYLYAVSKWGLSSRAVIARAPLADALDRDAWRFYDEKGNWTKNWESAAYMMNGATDPFSVHWSEHLQKYLAVHGVPLDSGFAIQMADRPEGPWSSYRRIYQGLPTKGRNIGLLAHPEFAREDGRIQYVTYSHPTGWFRGEIRLVELTFK